MKKHFLNFLIIFTLLLCYFSQAQDDVPAIKEFDPTNSLTNYVSLGEWNTNSDFEHWTYNTDISDCAVYGGSITGRVGGDDSHIDLTFSDAGKSVNLISGSVVEIKCRYDTNTINSVGRWYLNGGDWQFAFIADAGEQPTDGAFHIYRATLTGDVGNITSFRVDQYKSGNNGFTFSVDYIRIATSKTEVVESLISHGPMLGYVSECSAKIWFRTAVPTNVTVLLNETAIDSNIFIQSILTTSQVDNTAIIEFNNLKTNTEYKYTVSAGTTEFQAIFTTLSPSLTNKTIRIVYGYGYEPEQNGMPSGSSVFQNMAARDADVVLFLGDFPYTLYGAKDEIRAGNKELRSVVGFRDLTCSTPTYGIYDDHDFGPNDCDGTQTNADVALATFKNFWPNPYYGVPTNKGIYCTFVIGNVQFFLIDGRYNARFSKKTMLGEIQFNWLCNELKKSTCPYKVLVSGTEFGRVKDDGWGGKYYINERKKLFKFIYDNDIKGVIGISGDIHRSDIYKLPLGENRFFYDFTPGALSRIQRTPPNPLPLALIHSYGIADDNNMFGEIEFSPLSDKTNAITFRSYSCKTGLIDEFTLSPDELLSGEPVDIPAINEIDPSTPLNCYISLGEWNTNGNFENWICNSNITDYAVFNGSITGKISNADGRINLSLDNAGKYVNLVSGSVVEIRCRYKTGTSNSWVECYLYDGAWRVAFITNSFDQPADGQFHIYRSTLTTEIGDINALGIKPCNVTNEVFEIDYVRVQSPIMIDPTIATGEKFHNISLAEWNDNGDYGNWSLQNVSNAAVLNGVLSGVAFPTSDAQVYKNTGSGLPAVDLDTNKIIRIRLKRSIGDESNIEIFYGTDVNPGYDTSRKAVFNGISLPADGNFHIYQYDMSFSNTWESKLHDFRLDPLASLTNNFEIDYIRVGKIGHVPEPATFGFLSLLGLKYLSKNN